MDNLESLSSEARTAIEMIESLDNNQKYFALEKLRELVSEIQEETKWNQTLSSNPEPMRSMARKALGEHKNGKSWRF